MKFIWSKGAVADHDAGRETKRLLFHRVSNVTPEALDCFLRQLRPGTPWLVTDDDGNELSYMLTADGRRAV